MRFRIFPQMLVQFCLISLTLISSSVLAKTWDAGGDGVNVSSANNWSDNVAPSAAHQVIFGNLSSANATWNAAATATVQQITIENSYTGLVSIDRTLSVTNQIAHNSTSGRLLLKVPVTTSILNLTDNAQLQISLQGTNPSNNGKISVTGSAFNPNGTLKIILSGSVTQSSLPSFDIFDWQTISSNRFKNIQLPTLNAGYGWDLSQLYKTGVISITRVPGGSASVAPKMWLEANDDGSIYSSSNKVLKWYDKSGNNNIASQSSADTNRAPTWTDRRMNYKASLVFDGSNDQLRFSNFIGNDFTIAVVFKSAQSFNISDGNDWHHGAGLIDGESPFSVNDFGLSLVAGQVSAGTGNPDRSVKDPVAVNDAKAHVATFTRQKSTGNLRLYVDSKLAGSYNGAGTQTLNTPTSLTIGSIQTDNSYLNGDIAEILVFDSVLNSTQLNAMHADLVSKYAIDQEISPSDLLIHYPFNEGYGLVAKDMSSYKNNGTLMDMGASQWAKGIKGNAIYFDGSNDYISVPDLMYYFTSGLTFSGWVKESSVKSWSRIFDFGNGQSNNIMLTYQGTDNLPRFSVRRNTSEQLLVSSTTTPLNEWKHLVVTQNGSATTIYINGVIVASGSVNSALSRSRPNSYIAKSNWPDEFFHGYMDEFRIYNLYLSESEVKMLAANDGIFIWDNGAGNSLMSSGNNWLSDTVPAANSVLVFSSGSNNITWDLGNTIEAAHLQSGYTGHIVFDRNVTLIDQLYLTSASKIRMHLDSTVAGEYGRVTSYNFEPAGTLSITIDPSVTQTAGLTFDIFDWTQAPTSMFDNISLPALNPGLAWDLKNLYVNGTITIVRVPGNLSISPKLWLEANDTGSVKKNGSHQVLKWFDKSGNNSTATQPDTDTTKAPVWTTNNINSLPAMIFDGSNDQLAVNRIVQNSFTIQLVYKTSQSTSGGSNYWWDGPGLFDADTLSVAGDFGVRTNLGRVTFGMGDPDESTVMHPTSTSNNQPHVVTAVRDHTTGTFKLYVDSVSSGILTGTGGATLTSSSRIVIGSSQLNNMYFSGSIAEILVYDSVLSESQILASESALSQKYNIATPQTSPNLDLYLPLNESSGTTTGDQSGTGKTVQMIGFNGNEWTTGVYGNALNFDGTQSKRIQTNTYASSSQPSNFTLSAWIKTSYLDPDGSEILNMDNDFSMLLNSSGQLRGTLNTGSGKQSVTTSGAPLNDGYWHHLVYSYNSTGRINSLYVDGQNRLSSASSSFSNTVNYGKSFAGFEEDPARSAQYKGAMDEIRVYSRALSDSDVRDLVDATHYKFWTGNYRATSLNMSNTSNWASNNGPTVESRLIFQQSSDAAQWNLTSVNDIELRTGFTGEFVTAAPVTVTKSYTQAAGTKLRLQLDSSAASNNFGAIKAQGAMKLAGTLEIEMAGAIPAVGDRFNILDWGSLEGQFDDIILDPLSIGNAWDLSRLYIDGTIGVVAVPGNIWATPKLWLEANDAGSLILSSQQVLKWFDKSGYNNTASQPESLATKAPTWTDNAINSLDALAFDGSNDQLRTNRLITGDFTMSVVFKTSQSTGTASGQWYQGAGLIDANVTGTNADFGLSLVQGTLTAGVGNPDQSIRSPSSSHNGQAHIASLVRTKSSGSLTLYLDSQAVASITGASTADLNAATQLAIGSLLSNSGYFAGQIAEIVMFDEKLSDLNLDQMESALGSKYGISVSSTSSSLITYYDFEENGGMSATDRTGNGYSATPMNGASWGAGAKGYGMVLDGQNDYLNITRAYTDFSQGLSISMWIKHDSIQFWARLFESANGPNSDNIMLATSGSDNMLAYAVNQGSSGNIFYGQPLTLGDWNHVTITHDIAGAGLATMYINGKYINSANITKPLVISRSPTYIGRSHYSADGYTDASYDEIRVYNTPISQNVIHELISQSGYRFWDDGAGDGLMASANNWFENLAPSTSEILAIDQSSRDLNWNMAMTGYKALELRSGFTGNLTLSNPLTLSSHYTQRTNTSLTLTLDSPLDAEVGKIIAPDITLGGTLRINHSITAATGSFTLFQGSISGQFDNIILPPLADGFSWDLSNLYTAGTISIIANPGRIRINPVLWLAASDSGSVIRNSSSQEVSRWVNKAGYDSDINAVQSNASLRPTWLNNQQNGKPALQFVSNHMTSPLAVNPKTIIVVAKETTGAKSSNEEDVISVSGSSGYHHLNIRINRVSDGLSDLYSRGPAPNYTWLGISGPQFYSTNQYQLISARWEPNQILSLYTGGQYRNFITDTNTASAATTIGISGSVWNNTWYSKTMDIAEIILYSQFLSVSDMDLVESYLADKYGLTIQSPNAGLELNLPLDENTGISTEDVSGNGHHGTLANSPDWVTGISGSALAFNGTDQYIQGIGTSLPAADSNSTLSLWFKAAPGTSARTLFSWGNGNPARARSLSLTADNQLQSSVNDAAPNICSIPELDPDQWQQVSFVYEAGNSRIYYNGQLLCVDTEVASTSSGSSYSVARSASNDQYFDGIIDHIQIHPEVLTATELGEISVFNNYRFWTGADRGSNLLSTNGNNWVGLTAPEEDNAVVFASSGDNVIWTSSYSLESLQLRSGFSGKLALTQPMTLSQDYQQKSGSSLQLQIASSNPASNGSISASNISLGGTLEINLNTGSFTPTAGQTFTLFDGSISGQFDQILFSGSYLPAGLAWDFSQLYSDGQLKVMATYGGIGITPALWLSAADRGSLSSVEQDSSQYARFWTDKTGFNHSALQTTAASRPEIIDNRLNGHPSIAFDGVDDLLIGDNGFQLYRNFTMILIARVNNQTSAAEQGIISFSMTDATDDDSATQYGIALSTAPGDHQIRLQHNNSTPLDTSVANNFQFITLQWNNGVATMKIDGKNPVTQTLANSLIASYRYKLGARNDKTRHSQVELVEAMVFTNTLSDGQLDAVLSDLTDIYGIGFGSTQSGLSGHWPLDETTGISAANTANAAYNGLLENMTFDDRASLGRINGAVRFDGGLEGLNINNLPGQHDVYTLSAWIKVDGFSSSANEIFSLSNESVVRLYPDDRLQHSTRTTSSWNTHDLNSSGASDGSWHHIAVSWSDSFESNIYVDGQPATPRTTAAIVHNIGAPKYVGRHITNQNFGFRGLIDDVRIYDRVLSQAEIKALGTVTTSILPVCGSSSEIEIRLSSAIDPIMAVKTDEYVLEPYTGGTNPNVTDAVLVDPQTVRLTVDGLVPGTLYNFRVFTNQTHFYMPGQQNSQISWIDFQNRNFSGTSSIGITDRLEFSTHGSIAGSRLISGVFVAPYTGSFTFNTQFDNKGKIWFGDTLVEDTDSATTNIVNSPVIALTEGQQLPVRIEVQSTASDAADDLGVQVWADLDNDGYIQRPSELISSQQWQNCAGSLATAEPAFHEIQHSITVCDAPDRLLVYLNPLNTPSRSELEDTANYGVSTTLASAPVTIQSATRIKDSLVMLTLDPLATGTGYTVTAFGDSFKLATPTADSQTLTGQYFDQDTGSGKQKWTINAMQGNFQSSQSALFPLGNVYGQGTSDFSVRWQGSFTPDRSDSYNFAFSSLNDGARVYVDNKLVSSRWGDSNGNAIQYNMINLQANQSYAIRVDYIESDNTDAAFGLRIDADGDGSSDDQIPASMLRSCMPVAALTDLSLINHWTLDEDTATTALDSIGNSNLNLSGAASLSNLTSTHAIKGKALDFDGLDDRLLSSELLTHDNSDMTLSAWVKFDGVADETATILSLGRNHTLSLKQVPAANPRLQASYRRNTANSWYDGAGDEELVAERWYHLAYRFNTSSRQLELFVNGQLDKSFSGEAYTPLSPFTIAIGSNPWDATLRYQGLIDEVKMFSRALTDPEIKQLAGPNPTQALTDCGITNVNTTLYFDGNLNDFGGRVNAADLYTIMDLTTATPVTVYSASQSGSRQVILGHDNLTPGHEYRISAWGRDLLYTQPETKGWFLNGDWYDQPSASSYFEGTRYSSDYQQVQFASSTAAPLTGVGNTDFSGRFSGMFIPPRDGLYQFRVTHSAGLRLWINGAAVIDAWDNTSDTSTTASGVTLQKDVPVAVRLEMQHDTGPWQLEFRTQMLSSSSFDLIQSNAFKNCSGTGLSQLNHVISSCGLDTEVSLYFQDTVGLVDANNTSHYRLYSATGTDLGAPVTAALVSAREVVLTLPQLTAGSLYKIAAFGQEFLFAEPALETESGTQIIFDQNAGSGKVTASDGGLWTGAVSINTGNAHLSQNGHYNTSMATSPRSFKWTGYFTPPVTGTYELRVYSSAGIRVAFDNTLVINDWDESALDWGAGDVHTGSIALTAGEAVPVTLENWQSDATGHIKMDIEWPSTSYVSLMPASFRTCKPGTAGTPVMNFAAPICDSNNQILATFAEDLPADASNLSHYSLTGASISSVTALADGKSLLINTSSLTNGQLYKLTAFGTTLSFVASSSAQQGIYGGYFNQYANSDYKDAHYVMSAGTNAAFNGQSFVRLDSQINFNWASNATPITGLGNRDYSVRWQGSIIPTASGNYSFDSNFDGDETLRLWVNNVLISDDYKNMSSSVVPMEAGLKYPVRLDYLETGNNLTHDVNLQWAHNGGGMSLIPNTAFITCASPLAALNQAQMTAANSVCDNNQQMSLYFDHELSALVAENTSYYTVTPASGGAALTVSSAQLQTNPYEVILTMGSALTAGETYVINAFDRQMTYYQAPVATAGLYTSYFANTTYSGAADFVNMNDDLRRYFGSSPDGSMSHENMSTRSQGYWISPVSGSVQFRATWDDRILFWFGDQKLFEADSHSNTFVTSASVAVTAGQVWPLRLDVINNGLMYGYHIQYSTNGGSSWQDLDIKDLGSCKASGPQAMPVAVMPVCGVSDELLVQFNEAPNGTDAVNTDHYQLATSGVSSSILAAAIRDEDPRQVILTTANRTPSAAYTFNSFNHPMAFAEPAIHGPGLMAATFQQASSWYTTQFPYGDFPNIDTRGTAASRYDARIDLSPASLAALDSQVFYWNAVLLPDETGLHQFEMLSDDSAKIWIDASRVMNVWRSKDVNDLEAAQPVTLTADKPAPLSIRYFDDINTAEAYLKWTPPSSGSSSIIPSQNFYTCFPDAKTQVASVTPICRQNNQVRLYLKGTGLNSERLSHIQSYEVYDSTDSALTITNVAVESDQSITLTFASALSTNQLYRLRAFGQTSTFTVPSGDSYGLNGSYFSQDSGSGKQDWETSAFTGFAGNRIDREIQFATGGTAVMAGAGSSQFSIRWDGTFKAQAAGNYKLYLAHDDGVRVWADGVLILDQWAESPLTNHTSSTLSLAAGQQVALRIEYFHDDSNYALELQWILPGAGSATPLPTNTLSTCIGEFPEIQHVTTYCGTADRVLLQLSNADDLDSSVLNPADMTLAETANPTNTVTIARLLGLSDSILLRTASPMSFDTEYTLTAPKLSQMPITFMIPASDTDGLLQVIYTQNNTAGAYFTGDQLVNHGQNIDLATTSTGPTGLNLSTSSSQTAGPDHFSARWSGYLVPSETGSYSLQSTSDDGFRVWLDDALVIDNWHADTAAQTSAALSLTANKRYAIRAEYFENTGDASYNLSWQAPSASSYSSIPTTEFKSCSQPPDDADYPMQLLSVTAFCDDDTKLEVRFADDVPTNLLTDPADVVIYNVNADNSTGSQVAVATSLTRDPSDPSLVTVVINQALTPASLLRFTFYGQDYDFLVPEAERQGLNALFWNQEDASNDKVSGTSGYFTGDVSHKVAIPLLGDSEPLSGLGDTYFTARYTGIYVVPADGDYTFTLAVEGGASLWIDGKRKLNSWSATRSGTSGGVLDESFNSVETGLVAGQQLSIRVDHHRDGDAGQAQVLRLFVENASQTGGKTAMSQFATCKRSDISTRKQVTSVTNYCEATEGAGVTQILVNFNRSLTSAEVNTTEFLDSIKINGSQVSAVLDSNNDQRLKITTSALVNGSAYTLEVAGETYKFTPTAVQDNKIQGLYFNQTSGGITKTVEQFASFTGNSSTRLDTNINFEWTSSLPGPLGVYENFSGVWQGYILAPATDTYTFRTRSNNGARVFVGTNAIIDNYAPSYVINNSAVAGRSMSMEQGRLYPVRVEFRAGSKPSEQLRLQWSRLGDPTVDIVPGTQFYSCLPADNTTDTIEAADVSHFGIAHDGYGIYCLAEDSITISAYDSNGDVLTGFTGTIHISTSAGRGRWSSIGSGSITNNSNDNGQASYTFDAADLGVAKLQLDYYSGTTSSSYPANVNIDVEYDANSSIREISSLDPDLIFSPTGLILAADTDNTMVAGDTKTLTLTAYGQTPESNNCDVIETYNGAQTIDFSYDYFPTLDPTASTDTRPVNPTINGNSLSTTTSASQQISFTNGQADVQLKFKDVGRIMISASDSSNPDLGSRTLYGASDKLVVRPDHLQIEGISEASAVSSSTAANYTAGVPFTVNIGVYDSEGSTVPSFADTEEKVVLTHSLRAPAGGVSGTLAGGQASAWTQASPGIMTSEVSWSEVGFVTLTADMNTSSFLGVSGLGDAVTGDSIDALGRFKPARLYVEATVAGILLDTATNCGFVYQTQAGGSSAGQSMHFDSTAAPAIKIRGVSSSNATTYNYAHEDYWQLDSSNLRATYTNTASANASLNATSMAPNLSSPGASATYNSQGYREYVFENDSFVYEKAGASETAADLPFTPSFSMKLLGLLLTDSDGVQYDANADGSADDFTGFNPIANGPEIRFGRILGSHVAATGLEPINIKIMAQYWANLGGRIGFTTNSLQTNAGACSLPVSPSYYTSANAEENLGSISASNVSFTTPADWVSGVSQFYITANGDENSGPGDHLSGRIPVVINVPDYLEYDFYNDGSFTDPKASAILGTKNSNIIFQRQGYR